MLFILTPDSCSSPDYDLPHTNYLSFQQHSCLLLLSPLFSLTFPLCPKVFHGRPLFSITFPHRSLKKSSLFLRFVGPSRSAGEIERVMLARVGGGQGLCPPSPQPPVSSP
jgi:hypothetical protein